MTIPTNAIPGTLLYRAYAGHYYGGSSVPRINYAEYIVVRLTPKGAWVNRHPSGNIDMRYPDEKEGLTWYPFTCIFVAATKDEALYGLKRRKIRHRMHLHRKLIVVEAILKELGEDIRYTLETEFHFEW